MTTDYKIDLFENEIKSFKGLRVFSIIFISFFSAVGLFYLVEAYHKNSNWISSLSALTPFGMAGVIYLQSAGKWIYKRYLIVIYNEGTWIQSKLFGTTSLN